MYFSGDYLQGWNPILKLLTVVYYGEINFFPESILVSDRIGASKILISQIVSELSRLKYGSKYQCKFTSKYFTWKLSMQMNQSEGRINPK